MYKTSAALAAALDNQRKRLRLSWLGVTLTEEDILSCTYTASCCGGETVSVGNVLAASVSMTLARRYDLLDRVVQLEIGAEVEGEVQYVPLGTFAVAECKQGDETTTLTAYDAAYYAAGGEYVPTVQSGATVAAVLADIAAQCGIELGELPEAAGTTPVTGDLTGRTAREMLGLAAALVGRNVVIDREGKLALRWFTDSGVSLGADDYYTGELSADGTCVVAEITVTVTSRTTNEEGEEVEETTTLRAGEGSGGFSLENGYFTQEILDAVWGEIGDFTYEAGSCSFLGGALMEPGDLMTVTGLDGISHTLPVTTLTLGLDGGCKATVQAAGQSATASGAAVLGPVGQALRHERTAREQAIRRLAQSLGDNSGMYITTELQPDGSSVYYMHNKPALADSNIVWKLTATAFGISTDGGKSYPYGFTVTGEMIMNVLQATGINADWINAGSITVKDNEGNVIFSADVDTKKVSVGGFSIKNTGLRGPNISLESASDGGGMLCATGIQAYGEGDASFKATVSNVVRNQGTAIRVDVYNGPNFDTGESNNLFLLEPMVYQRGETKGEIDLSSQLTMYNMEQDGSFTETIGLYGQTGYIVTHGIVVDQLHSYDEIWSEGPLIVDGTVSAEKVEINGVDIFKAIYPVGSVYMSVNNVNPSKLFGGTWVAWGSGRVPVGVDTKQTEFNAVEKTGGNKNMQSHTHGTGSTTYSEWAVGKPDGMQRRAVGSGTGKGFTFMSSGADNQDALAFRSATASAGSGNAQNLQPYITCYMWKRTA